MWYDLIKIYGLEIVNDIANQQRKSRMYFLAKSLR